MTTAIAHPNIALVKYWGKSDDRLMLPASGSLSLTLDVFPTRTSVALDDTLAHDAVQFDGSPAQPAVADRVTAFLDLVRERAGSRTHARVTTRNSVPTGAGLASSASGFAALAVAAAGAYGLQLDPPSLSRLARRGSGSAARSIVAGAAVWHAGDDRASFAEPVGRGPALGMVVVVVRAERKKVSSRDAMRRTRESSPYFDAWLRSSEADLDAMLAAFARDDFTAIGEITESNALRMHAAIQASRPPIRYLAPESLRVFDTAERLRADGLAAYATADAGPNVVLLCREGDVAEVRDEVVARLGLPDTAAIAAHAGPGAHTVPDARDAAGAQGAAA